MTWPTDLADRRYPGTVRREISVDCSVEDDRVIFDGSLRDHWFDTGTGQTEEIHGWRVRLAATPPDLTVIMIEAQPHHLPFGVCPLAARTVTGLLGARLTHGFADAVKKAVGGTDGCTHLVALLMTMANQRVVANYLHSRTQQVPPLEARARRERMVNACSGWRDGGEAITLTRSGRPLPLSRIHEPRKDETSQIEEASG